MYVDDYFVENEITPIEYLGWAKNSIVEAQTTTALPDIFREKLHQAYTLLDEVQEYLFNTPDRNSYLKEDTYD